MPNEPTGPTNSTGRRDFLKSLFGLSGALESPPPKPPAGTASPNFYWSDLTTGQIGFPTGTTVPHGMPGSIMKLVAAAAIREDNLLSANSKFECVGSVSIRRKKYNCQIAHGSLTMTEAIGLSCNCFFAQAAEALSPKIFMEFARLFRLDQPVADYPILPLPKHLLSESQPYVLGLSEDLQLNALQIMQLAALVGKRGLLPKLHSAEQPGGAAVPLPRALSEGTWSMLQQGMQLAVRLGTAKQLDVENRMRIAAKTGTTPHGKTFQSWITGYFPYDKPRHAFVLRSSVGTSQDQAVPLAHKFLFATQWPE
jgi:cell division protein FtsI/penicillin-binding protein 2